MINKIKKATDVATATMSLGAGGLAVWKKVKRTAVVGAVAVTGYTVESVLNNSNVKNISDRSSRVMTNLENYNPLDNPVESCAVDFTYANTLVNYTYIVSFKDCNLSLKPSYSYLVTSKTQKGGLTEFSLINSEHHFYENKDDLTDLTFSNVGLASGIFNLGSSYASPAEFKEVMSPTWKSTFKNNYVFYESKQIIADDIELNYDVEFDAEFPKTEDEILVNFTFLNEEEGDEIKPTILENTYKGNETIPGDYIFVAEAQSFDNDYKATLRLNIKVVDYYPVVTEVSTGQRFTEFSFTKSNAIYMSTEDVKNMFSFRSYDNLRDLTPHLIGSDNYQKNQGKKGTYKLTYEVTDNAVERSVRFVITITVTNDLPPIVIINGTYKVEVSKLFSRDNFIAELKKEYNANDADIIYDIYTDNYNTEGKYLIKANLKMEDGTLQLVQKEIVVTQFSTLKWFQKFFLTNWWYEYVWRGFLGFGR